MALKKLSRAEREADLKSRITARTGLVTLKMKKEQAVELYALACAFLAEPTDTSTELNSSMLGKFLRDEE